MILIFLAIFSAMTVAYADTYLNSCGKSSGWTDDTTYVLNFSQVGPGYTNYWCLNLPARSPLENVTITSETGKLDILKDGTFKFISRETSVEELSTTYHDNIIIKDIHFKKYGPANATTLLKKRIKTDTKVYTRNLAVENVTMENFDTMIEMEANDDNLRIESGRFQNIKFYGNVLVDNVNDGASLVVSSILINNSVIMTDKVYDLSPVNFLPAINPMSVEHRNSVVISHENSTNTGINEGTTFNKSIVQGFPHDDTDNDGIADTNLYSGMTDMRIWMTIDDIRYLQDTVEGKQGIRTDEAHFVVDDHEADFTQGAEYPDIRNATYYFNNRYVQTNLSNVRALNLGTDGAMRIYPYEPNNALIDIVAGGSSSAQDYRGIIAVGDDNTISGIRFGQSLSPTLAQFISNLDGGNTISDFDFSYNDVLLVGFNSSNGGGQFRLRSYLADIHHNEFSPAVGVGNEEIFLNISGFKDRIYRNEFEIPNGNYYLCGFCSGGQRFYNNYFSENVYVAKSGYVPDIELNNTVAYEEDGTVYYFNIGNYWNNNSGCTDTDGDGICDSPYTTANGFIDERPLAEYPFNFSEQKLNAEKTITETEFNVTLVEPQENQSYSLDSSSDEIDITFNHDSDFPDLVCDFVIDGVVEDTIFTPEKGVDNTISFSGWTEGDHTTRIECYNDYRFEASPTNTFSVSIDDGGDTTNGDDADDGTGLDPSGISSSGGQIITGNIEETRNNVISVFGLFNLPLLYGAYLGMVFLAIVFLVLLFSVIYILIPKK